MSKEEPTIPDLVVRVHQAAVATGVDLSPRDAAFIISLFLEGLAVSQPHINAVDAWLNGIADQVNRVRDEA